MIVHLGGPRVLGLCTACCRLRSRVALLLGGGSTGAVIDVAVGNQHFDEPHSALLDCRQQPIRLPARIDQRRLSGGRAYDERTIPLKRRYRDDGELHYRAPGGALNYLRSYEGKPPATALRRRASVENWQLQSLHSCRKRAFVPFLMVGKNERDGTNGALPRDAFGRSPRGIACPDRRDVQ